MWLIDISNTFTKCSCYRNNRHTGKICIPTAQITSHTLDKIYLKYDKPTEIFASSVVPGATKILKTAFPHAKILSGSAPLPIPLKYPKPSEIGADRIANAIALHALGKYPAMAVDFGTAITIDILDHEGAYVGGVIAPGWQSMLHYLHEKTALLPLVKLIGKPPPIGKNTKQAICSGVYYGFIGLVQNIIKNSVQHLATPPQLIVATGGDSSWISKNIPLIQKTIPNLTLNGLGIYADFVKSSKKTPKDAEL